MEYDMDIEWSFLVFNGIFGYRSFLVFNGM